MDSKEVMVVTPKKSKGIKILLNLINRGVIEPNQYSGKLELDSKFDVRYSARARSSIVFLARARLEMKIKLLEFARLSSIPNYSLEFELELELDLRFFLYK